MFCKSNEIFHSRSAPYNSQSNCKGKRFVYTFMEALNASSAYAASANRLASEFFLRYRVSLLWTTSASLLLLLINRLPWTKFDLLHTDKAKGSCTAESDKSSFYYTANTCVSDVGDAVFSRNYFGRYRWIASVILRWIGPFSYYVKVRNSVKNRHAFKFRKGFVNLDYFFKKEKIDCDISSTFNAGERNEEKQTAKPKPYVPLNQMPQPQIFSGYGSISTCLSTNFSIGSFTGSLTGSSADYSTFLKIA